MKKVIVVFVIIVIIGVLFFIFNRNGISDGKRFEMEYEELNDSSIVMDIDSDNIIKYIDLKTAIDIINNDSGVIYFGYPSCPWCRNAVPVLLDASSGTSLDTIYYVDVTDVRDVKEIVDGEVVTSYEGDPLYDDLLEVMDSVLDDYVIDGVNLNEKRLYVPMVIFVKNGKIVDYHLSTVDSQEDPSISLNEEQRNELYNIYLDGINSVIGGVCSVQESGSC